ncbi:MAG: Flp family type IVb pilin [Phycisphaeraceae bacterium]|nr:Flp family type IVb pilin [Phycisphaeraceae bacterium]
MKRLLVKLRRDVSGATALEWTLLLAVIVLPSYAIIRMALDLLVAHYQLIVTLNGLPFP